MKIIRIELDFLFGPIVKDEFDVTKNETVTGVSAIDSDEELQILNAEISNLYSSFYDFNVKNQPCLFNKTKFNDNKQKLLILLEQLTERLNTINDGSFTIEDFATPSLLKDK